jgi:ribosomal protein S18 acetylase RimI-like enzyme
MKSKTKGSSDVYLITMNSNHVSDVVDIHMLSFLGFFLTYLGKNFLSVYYNAITNHDNAIKIVLVNNTKVIGFVVGAIYPAGFYSSLIKNDIFSFAQASIPALMKKPQFLFKILRIFSKPKHANQSKSVSELTSLAVLPQYQEYGYGQLLVSEFVAQCRERSGNKIILTTDAMNNEKVNQFYCKAGFVLSRSFTTLEKRFMNEYEYTIS